MKEAIVEDLEDIVCFRERYEVRKGRVTDELDDVV